LSLSTVPVNSHFQCFMPMFLVGPLKAIIKLQLPLRILACLIPSIIPLIEISLPGVVPSAIFSICIALAVVAVAFVLVQVGFIVSDHVEQSRHELGNASRHIGDEMV